MTKQTVNGFDKVSMTPLDIEDPTQLVAYLQAEGRIAKTEPLEIRVLGGGVSNRTVWLKRPSGEAWVLKQALEKLRTKADWFSSVERIHREATGMRWLFGLAPAGSITQLIFEDHNNHVLAMQAVPEPHENWKAMLLRGQLEPEHMRQFARLLGLLHQQSYQNEKAATEFADRSFFESLRLEPYYLYAAVQQPKAADFLNNLMEENRANLLSIVHGDYSPKNVLVHEGQLVLLDHEVIHFGDPTFDLGFSMTHLLSKAHHLPNHGVEFLRAVQEYWDTYSQTAPTLTALPGFEARAVRQTLGCLLARVDGRSPLEYLNEAEGSTQREAVLEMMLEPPAKVADLISGFAQRIQA